jgi:F-box/leucine-rich repeat protein 10/11
VNLKFFQEKGFEKPILVKSKSGLNMKTPSANFTVRDVERYVGSKRLVDVMDVNTQKNFEMTLKEWREYFTNPVRERLLNVISLEFSHTELANMIEPPLVIKQLDWVNSIWPQYLKLQQTESTNSIGDMKYPKVQK